MGHLIHKNKAEDMLMEAYDKYAEVLFAYCYEKLLDKEKARAHVEKVFCETWMHMTQKRDIENMHGFLYATADAVMNSRTERRIRIPLRHFVHVCHEKISNFRIHFK